MIAMLERHVAASLTQVQSSLIALNEKAASIPKVDAQYEFIKQDIERIYARIKELKMASDEAMVRIHSRLDTNNTTVVSEVSKLQEQLSNATTRIEENLGDKVETQAVGLSELKNDYEQKIASIKAVWYVAGLFMLLLQGVGAFLVKSYISAWQTRIESAEKETADNKRHTQQLEDSIKELQNETILEKSGK
jgi:hypothetical protein